MAGASAADVILSELLQGLVGIGGLVVGVGIDQRRLAIEHDLAQDHRHRFALGKPLAPQARKLARRLRFTKGNPARAPAIGKSQIVQGIEHSRCGGIGKAQHGERAHVLIAELWLDTAEQGRVAQDGVEMRGQRRHRHGVALMGDGAV